MTEQEPTLEEPQEAIAELESDCVPLTEAVKEAVDGAIPIKLIQPGWGSTGYYSAELLARDGPKAFARGTKMYWNHITKAEEAQRPEGDLRNLAGELVEDARWESELPTGPGLYARAKVFSAFRPAVKEMAPHIGLSIRAWGKHNPGEAEGRKGPVVERIAAGRSVDFVTQAGAGGQVVEMFEAARDGGQLPVPAAVINLEANTDMDEAKEKEYTDQIATLTTENARLTEALILHEARAIVTETLNAEDLPDLTRARLSESLATKPALKDGALDRDSYVAQIKEAAKAEREYLAALSGAGKIRGMGAPPAEGTKSLHESFVKMYLRQGKTQAEAETMAAIAAQGR